MNTDGRVSNETHLVGIGVVISNQRGLHVASLAANIGFASNITTELRAIRDGLIMLIRLEINNIHIQTDSLIAVNMITRKKAVRVVH